MIKRDLDDDSDGVNVTSFGIEFQTEAKENQRSVSVALLCVGLPRRGMVCELVRVITFHAACQRHMMAQYCYDSGSSNKLYCKSFLLLQEANEVILNVWLY